MFAIKNKLGQFEAFHSAEYEVKVDASITLWCQIEDKEALGEVDSIAALKGVDYLFIGPADLNRSLGGDADLRNAVATIAAAGLRHGRTVGIFVGNLSQLADVRALGITQFGCGSDQSFLLNAARHAKRDFVSVPS